MTAVMERPLQTLDPEAREKFVAEAEGTALALETRVREIKAASVDAKADTRTLTMVPITDVLDATAVDLGALKPSQRVALTVPNQSLRLGIAENAHGQIAAKLDIPRKYYDRMLAEAPDLLATNVNRWFNQNADTRLVRILKPTTPEEATFMDSFDGFGTVRGFLSGKYRPLDNPELLASVLPIAAQHGAYLRDFSLDDQRLHARFATFERSAQSIVQAVAERYGLTEEQAKGHHRVGGKDITFVDEMIRAGFSIRNSETGYATLDVAAFIEILKCLNGMIVPAQVKARHVGGKRDVDETGFGWESEQTQRLDNAAVFSRVRDAVIATLDEQVMGQNAAKIISAKATVLELPEPLFEFIGRIGEKEQLTDAEVEVLREETHRAVIEEGATTRFAMAQGFTASAKQANTFDRRTEMERMGWAWLTDSTTKLLAAGSKKGKAATN